MSHTGRAVCVASVCGVCSDKYGNQSPRHRRANRDAANRRLVPWMSGAPGDSRVVAVPLCVPHDIAVNGLLITRPRRRTTATATAEIRGNGTSRRRRNAARISGIIKHYWKSVGVLSPGPEKRRHRPAATWSRGVASVNSTALHWR